MLSVGINSRLDAQRQPPLRSRPGFRTRRLGFFEVSVDVADLARRPYHTGSDRRCTEKQSGNPRPGTHTANADRDFATSVSEPEPFPVVASPRYPRCRLLVLLASREYSANHSGAKHKQNSKICFKADVGKCVCYR